VTPFIELEFTSPDVYPWTLHLREVKDVPVEAAADAGGREGREGGREGGLLAAATRRFGERHPAMHRAIFAGTIGRSAPFRVRVLLRHARLSSLLPPIAIPLLRQVFTGIARKITASLSLSFADEGRRITKVYRESVVSAIRRATFAVDPDPIGGISCGGIKLAVILANARSRGSRAAKNGG